MDMNFFKDQRVVAAIGAALALLAGLVIAITLMSKGAKTKPDADADAGSDGSLQVEMNAADGGLDVSKPLRCFVDGQFVGVLSLNECAARNGVATGALDVGLDPNGAIVAGEGDVPMQPLPQPVTA
ncbi:MAG: hypothetical protein ACXW3D_03735, partial [Caulobacteraceae bacterium]